MFDLLRKNTLNFTFFNLNFHSIDSKARGSTFYFFIQPSCEKTNFDINGAIDYELEHARHVKCSAFNETPEGKRCTTRH